MKYGHVLEDDDLDLNKKLKSTIDKDINDTNIDNPYKLDTQENEISGPEDTLTLPKIKMPVKGQKNNSSKKVKPLYMQVYD